MSIFFLQIVADETGMTTGQLSSMGVLNYRALNLLAAERLLTYNFQFYSTNWDADVRVLLLSRHPSLIKPALTLPWAPPSDPAQLNKPLLILDEPALLAGGRRYLLSEAVFTSVDYTISTELQQVGIPHPFQCTITLLSKVSTRSLIHHALFLSLSDTF